MPTKTIWRKIVRGIREREKGGRPSGGSRNWGVRVDLPGWNLYDFSIHEISRRNATASFSQDNFGITFNGKTSWDGGFGAGGNYEADVTAHFYFAAVPSPPPPGALSVASLHSNNLAAFNSDLSSIESRIAAAGGGPSKVALQANNGQFICAEDGGGSDVMADRSAIGPWETFGLVDLGGGKVALQANNGQFVCAEGGGGGGVVADRDRIGPWETFTLHNLGGDKVALQANNGQFVCAEGGGGRGVVADRSTIGPWETFSQVKR